MWEITLCGKYTDIFYLLEMEKVLKDNLYKDIVSVVWINDDVICNLATLNERYIEYTKKIIIETILKIAKTDFFKKNLNINIKDKSLQTFLISSLVMIDLEEEIEFVYNHFSLDKYININSFINFKLNDLKEKWLFLVNYINKTFLKSFEDSVYLDFLKFLTDLQSPKYEVLYLDKYNENLELFDNKNKKIKSISCKDEVGVIVNLIMLCPRKIIIKCLDKLSSKFSNLIEYIFDEKLSFIL